MTNVVTRFAYRIFGPLSAGTLSKYPEMSQDFLKARILIHPHAYLALTYFAVAATSLTGFAAGIGISLVAGTVVWGRVLLLAFVQAGLAGLLCYLYMMTYPQLRIRARARRIDASLPHALNFISSLSSAGVIPTKMFGALAQQGEYELVAEEARWIYRDVQMLGLDIVDALLEASRRSASRQFSEFLQGTVSTILSGGNLSGYFMQRSQYAAETVRRGQRAFIENLGVLAESYLVTAVAGPLFLIVIVSVLTLLSSRSVDPLYTLKIIIFMLLPVSHIVFGTLIGKMKPEG